MDQLVEYAKTLEITVSQQREMKNPGASSINAVKQAQAQKPAQSRNDYRQTSTNPSSICNNCGNAWPHAGGQSQCPAHSAECAKCHKLHHYAKMCQSSGGNDCVEHKHYRKNNYHRKRKPNRQKPNSIPAAQVSQVTTCQSHVESHIEYVYVNKLPFITVHIQGQPVKMMVDTGASVDIMDEQTWNKLYPGEKLSPTDTRLIPYGSREQLKAVGQNKGPIAIKQKEIIRNLYFIQGSSGSLCIINRSGASTHHQFYRYHHT